MEAATSPSSLSHTHTKPKPKPRGKKKQPSFSSETAMLKKWEKFSGATLEPQIGSPKVFPRAISSFKEHQLNIQPAGGSSGCWTTQAAIILYLYCTILQCTSAYFQFPETKQNQCQHKCEGQRQMSCHSAAWCLTQAKAAGSEQRSWI